MAAFNYTIKMTVTVERFDHDTKDVLTVVDRSSEFNFGARRNTDIDLANITSTIGMNIHNTLRNHSAMQSVSDIRETASNGMKLYRDKYPVPKDTEYVIEHVYDPAMNTAAYFQLVRIKDDAILAACTKLEDVWNAAWRMEIPHKRTAAI